MILNSLSDIKSVIVPGNENILVLTVIRALGKVLPKAKIHTISFKDSGLPPWQSSKYIDQCHYFHSRENSVMKSDLMECIKKTGADIVLPAGEEFVRFLSLIQDDVKSFSLLPPLPSTDLFDQLVSKDKLNDLLIANGLPHPVNYKLDDEVLNNWDFDSTSLLLKPTRGSSGTGMRKVDNERDLQLIKKEFPPDKYFLQEMIEGETISSSSLAINGEIIANSIHKTLYQNGFNFPTAMEFMHQEEIYTSTLKLFQFTGYSGLANLDFRLDEKDGVAKLIDFNPRFWVSLLGSRAAGIDFAKLYCLAALGHSVDKQEYKKCVYLMGKSSLKYYTMRLMHPFTHSQHKSTYTDIWERLGDIKPELFRYTKAKS